MIYKNSMVCEVFTKVATDTNILYLRTRYRYMKGVSSGSFRYLDTDTINKSRLKMYLRYRYRSKLGCFFWFGPIHVTIRRNLDGIYYDHM